MRSSTSCSNFARVSVKFKCFGPSAVAVMNGKLISVCESCDSSIFAFSAASRKRCNAIGSLRRSMPSVFLNSSAMYSSTRISKLSPPRCVSPLVDFTSNTPSPNSSTEISNVPPPRSNTATFASLFFLSIPYASAAAVGSLIIRKTSSPAIRPASLVAWRC